MFSWGSRIEQMLHAMDLRSFVYSRGKAYKSRESLAPEGDDGTPSDSAMNLMARTLALLLRQGLSAIEVLQEHSIRHEDIIPRNVMVVPTIGRNSGNFQLVLLDFCRAQWARPRALSLSARNENGANGLPVVPFHRNLRSQVAGADHNFDLYSLACTLIDG
jgi:hypothetical protein